MDAELPMDRKYIDMHLLIERYLQGSLAEAEQVEFEERLVWDQELMDELSLAERMREGLKASAADVGYSVTAAQAGPVNRLFGLLSVPQYAAAASFLLAVTLTTALFLSPLGPDSNSGDYAATPSAVPPDLSPQLNATLSALQNVPTEIVPLFAVRGASPQAIVVNDASWVVLLVDVVASYDSYRVSVRKDESGAEPFWMQDGLSPTYPDALAVGLPGSSLPPGEYILSIDGTQPSQSGEKAFEHIQEIHFETAFAD